jgi:CheY-like chemotaxis protein
VVLEIKDTGKGIAKSDIHRIFDPFFTTKVMGRGLGLAAARGALKAASGAMEVESEVGKGASFRIWLPVSPQQPDDGAGQDAPRQGVLVGDEDTTILVVDDDASTLEIVCQHFRQAGFRVLGSDDGAKALALIKEHTPAVALIDFTMPKMMGDELAQNLREATPTTKIALMSGYSVEHVESHLDMDLFDAFLPKPFEPIQLNAVIGRWFPHFLQAR